MFSDLDRNTQTRLFYIVNQWSNFLSHTHKRMDDLLNQTNAGMEILISKHALDTNAILSAWRCLTNRFLDLKEDATDDYNRNTSALSTLIDISQSRGHSVVELKHLALSWTKQYDAMVSDLESRFCEIKNQKDQKWAERLSSFDSQRTALGNRYTRETRPLNAYRHLSVSVDAQQQF